MISDFYMHSVSVETYTGPGETGDTYAAPVTVAGLLDDGLSLIRNSPTGDVVESATIFYTDLANAAVFIPQSRVSTTAGVMQVVTVKRRDGGGILGPVSHAEVRLQ